MSTDPTQPAGGAVPPPPPPPPGSQAPGAPGMAIAGFVCGLVGLILSVSIICWLIGGPVALVGIILSVIGRRQAEEKGAKTGLATAGLVCGIIGLLVAIIITVAVIVSGDAEFRVGSSLVLAPLLGHERVRALASRLRRAEDLRR